MPGFFRSDNGPEFTAEAVRAWLPCVGVTTLFIEPGSPWENGYVESFNEKLGDEFLNREIFDTLFEARVLIERWRIEYNTIRPHGAREYRPPAPETIELVDVVSVTWPNEATYEAARHSSFAGAQLGAATASPGAWEYDIIAEELVSGMGPGHSSTRLPVRASPRS